MKVVPNPFFRSTRAYRRFARTRDIFETRVGCSGPLPWSEAAQTFLNKAEDRLTDRDLDGAWCCLMEAMRTEITALRGQNLRSREQIFRCEAEKIQSHWRSRAIDELMKEADQDEEKRAQRLESAQALLDDFFQNQYHKNRLLQSQLRNLLLITFVALLSILILIGRTGTDLTQWPEWNWKTLLVVLLFGVLGASFSATRNVTDSSGKSIPEISASLSITVARTVLGATPGLAAYAFLKSGILSVGSNSASTKLAPIVLAISFAAGFSERLVLRVLETLDGKAVDKPAKKK
jgi:hypothetical protein